MYLIDTDIIVFALRQHPGVTGRLREEASQPKAISVVTYGELPYGAGKSRHPQANLAKVRRMVELFPVVEVSSPVIETFAALKASLERKGSRLDDFDLLIASTALTMNYRLVTNNERHFRRIPGLAIEN